MTPTGLSQYLVRWEQSFDEGRDLPARELCPEHPHLAIDLDRCINLLRNLRQEMAPPPTRPGAPTRLDSDPIPPTRLGESTGSAPALQAGPTRFLPIRPIAQGGLGKVSLATDLELHREVALKEIQDDLADRRSVRARFLFEAEVTGKLEHPGVVPVYGLGCYADGRPYYAMRFIEGESLHEAIARFHAALDKDAPLPLGFELRELLTRFVAVCNTIAYAHSRGIIHRDIKPANIMLGAFGETLVVDWGLAKSLNPGLVKHVPDEPTLLPDHAERTGPETLAGSAIGTPQFMSPEQAAGDLAQVGPASDIYSLGATLYHLLTGEPPFADATDVLLRKVQSGDFTPPSKLRREIPPALEAICLKAMARQPEARYPCARDLAADLERWLADEPVSARRDSAYERLLRWIRRHRSWVVSIGWALTMGLGCLAVAVVLLSSAYESEKKAHQEADANRERAEAAFRTAREAVDRSFTRISEDALLNQHGMQPLRKSLLQDALVYYRRFLEERGDDPSLKRQCADAHFREGRILELTGPPGEALPAYGKALALLRELGEGEEPPPEVLASLGDTLNALGRVRHKLHQLDEASKFYEEAASTRSRLFASQPLNSTHGRALANSWMNIGLVFKDKGKPGEARKYLANAQALRGELRGQDNPALKREIAMGEYNIGLLEMTQNAKAAHESLRAALAGFDAVTAAEPNDLNSLYLLAICCRLLGDLKAVPGQEKESQALYDRSRKALEQLAIRNPGVPQYQTALAELLLNIGAQHLREGQFDDAWATLTRSGDIYESLPAEVRHSARSVRDLAVCQRLQGAILIERGKREEARKVLNESRQSLERLTKAFPKNADYAAQLAQTQALLAKLTKT